MLRGGSFFVHCIRLCGLDAYHVVNLPNLLSPCYGVSGRFTWVVLGATALLPLSLLILLLQKITRHEQSSRLWCGVWMNWGVKERSGRGLVTSGYCPYQLNKAHGEGWPRG